MRGAGWAAGVPDGVPGVPGGPDRMAVGPDRAADGLGDLVPSGAVAADWAAGDPHAASSVAANAPPQARAGTVTARRAARELTVMSMLPSSSSKLL